MNHLYRVVWNRAVRRFVVTSELASSRTRSGSASLAATLLVSLLGPLSAQATEVADGTRVTLAPGDYNTTADGESVIEARNGGDLSASGVDLTSSGNAATGVSAISGGNITLDNSDVTTHGNGATGVLSAGLSGDASQVTVNDSNVTTDGNNATGMAAIHSGEITGNNVNVSTSGSDSIGVIAGEPAAAGSDVPIISLTNSSITTSGANSAGLVGQGLSGVYLGDSSVTTQGDGSTGIVTSDDSIITTENTTVTTTGDNANGVNVVNDGMHTRFEMTGGGISTAGDQSIGLYNDNGHYASVTNATVSTSGTDSAAIVALGTNSTGVRSTVVVSGSQITTGGEQSAGLVAQDGGSISASDSGVTTTGDNAAGVVVTGEGSRVNLTASNVDAQGQGSSAAQMSGGTLSLNGGSLTSAQGSAIEINAGGSGMSLIDLNHGAQASGGNGVFVQNNDESQSVGINLDQRSRVQGDIIGVDSNGDGQITATTDMTLNDMSSWQGATNGAVDQLALSGGSEWTMTGDSTVGQVDLNNSTIAFAQPTNGDFKTLTVTGDFNSDGGVLLMNSELNGDDSPSDMLHVEGSTSGQAYVHVNNVGGVGDTTTDGIELIQVDGQSDAQFDLAGRAVGGSEEYFLYQGSYTDPNDGDWYLRSELPTDPTDPIVPPPVDPGEPGDPTDPIVPPPVDPGDPTDPIVPPPPTAPAVPVYRPEVGSYLSNQAAAVNMFQLSMHDRLGTPELDPQKLSDDRLGSLWVRVNRTDTDYTGGKGQLDVDSDTSVLQIGADLAHWGEYGRGIFGVMAGTGSNENTTRSGLTGYSSKGEVDGTAVGIYGTWFANPTGETGLYVDSWLQYGRYDNSVQGEGLDEENYDSRTLAGSIEAGYSWNVFSNETSRVYVQPQLQITATHYNSDDHQETNGTEIKSDEAGGVTTRTGMRVYSQINLDSGMKVQPYADVNWYHNSRDNAVAFNDSVMQGGDPKDRYEFKTGAQLVLGKHWSTWGQVGVQSGEDDYGNVSGQVGLKYNF
jgi:autotransporter family porin